MKDLADGPDVFVGFEQQRPLGIVAGHASSQLAAVLDVLEHPGHDRRRSIDADIADKRALRCRWQVIDGCNSTLVIQFAHKTPPDENQATPCISARILADRSTL